MSERSLGVDSSSFPTRFSVKRTKGGSAGLTTRTIFVPTGSASPMTVSRILSSWTKTRRRLKMDPDHLDDVFFESTITPSDLERIRRWYNAPVASGGKVYTFSTPWEFGDPVQEFYRGDPGDETQAPPDAPSMTADEFERAWGE